MTLDKIEQECDALKTIRQRWRLRGWKFTPLERIDGVNETLESIDALRNSPVCWASVTREHEIEKLLDDLEESYRYAFEPWTEHRTVFDCKATQREFLRWPDGTFSKGIQHDARYRFWELVTTSRFSVNAVPVISDLQRVNWTSNTVSVRHAASLAAMVCITEAIETLELIEDWWREDSRAYRAGKPFKWLTEHDPSRLDMILSVMLDTPEDIRPCNQKINDALKARDQANAWLSHLTTLNFSAGEIKQSVKVATAEKSKKAQAAASVARKAKDLTPEVVATYFNKQKTEKWETVRNQLAEKFQVSASTVDRRYRSAKEKNLVS